MKKLVRITLAGFLGLTAITSVALADYGRSGKLAGYVKEAGSLIPLSQAKVKLYNKNGRLKDSDTTGNKGKYVFSDIDAGTYRVKAKKEGYRNPRNFRRDYVSRTVKVSGSDRKNLYLQKI